MNSKGSDQTAQVMGLKYLYQDKLHTDNKRSLVQAEKTDKQNVCNQPIITFTCINVFPEKKIDTYFLEISKILQPLWCDHVRFYYYYYFSIIISDAL